MATAATQIEDSLQQLCAGLADAKKKDEAVSSAGGTPALSLKKGDDLHVDPKQCTIKFIQHLSKC